MAYQEPKGQTRQEFFRKLGYYAAGIAIGFVALGFFQRMRGIERERRAREEAALHEQAAASSLFPPPPGSVAPDGATPPSPEAP